MEPIPRNRALVVWRKHRIKISDRKRLSRTICDVLGDLYQGARDRDDALSMHRIEEANDMAKRMQDKLKRYARGKKSRLTLTINEHGELVWVSKGELRSWKHLWEKWVK